MCNHQDRNHCDKKCKVQTLIKQYDFRNKCCETKPYIICKSGKYALCQNVRGQILIKANNVTLDLCSHEINGKGSSSAIFSNNHYNVTIKNGTVTNTTRPDLVQVPSGQGISIVNGQDIELHDLNVIETSPVGVKLENVSGFRIAGCDFSKNDQALLLLRCKSGKVSNCAAYDNTNKNETLTTSAVLSLESCDCVQLVDVDVCNNTKNVLVDTRRQGVLTVTSSFNVSLERCKVNGNGTDLPFISMSNLLFISSKNCTVTDCQTNNNSILDGINSGLVCNDCHDCTIYTSQANHNKLNGSSDFILYGFALSGSTNCIIKNCQANDNVSSGFIIGILIGGSPDSQIVNCQANNNRGIDTQGIFGIFSDNISIVGCQGNNNHAEIFSAAGILMLFSNNTRIVGCQCNNNTGETGNSIGISSGFNPGIIIEDSEANNNSTVATNKSLFAVGIYVESSSFSESKDIRIVNCVANGNNSTVQAYGIVLAFNPNEQVSPSNAVIKCCQVCDTVSSSEFSTNFAAGIGVFGANDVSIQNCQVYDTKVTGVDALANAAGIYVENTLRCNIENCETHKSTTDNPAKRGDGILLTGSTNNSTVQDSISLGNQNAGFSNTGYNFNYFAGNFAEDNKQQNYFDKIPAPVIFSFDKSTGLYTYDPILPVGTQPNKWSNIAVPNNVVAFALQKVEVVSKSDGVTNEEHTKVKEHRNKLIKSIKESKYFDKLSDEQKEIVNNY